MTTRAQLESEREALRDIADRAFPLHHNHRAALTASIARVEALLSLDDAEADKFVEAADAEVAAFDGHAEYAGQLHTLRTVANLIRREPRGDV